jgi:hypothetical protein
MPIISPKGGALSNERRPDWCAGFGARMGGAVGRAQPFRIEKCRAIFNRKF